MKKNYQKKNRLKDKKTILIHVFLLNSKPIYNYIKKTSLLWRKIISIKIKKCVILSIFIAITTYGQIGIETNSPTKTIGVIRIRNAIQIAPTTSAKDYILAFDADGVVKIIFSNMVVASTDPSYFANSENFTN